MKTFEEWWSKYKKYYDDNKKSPLNPIADAWKAGQAAFAQRCLEITNDNHYVDGVYIDILQEADKLNALEPKPNYWHSFREADDY